MAAVVLGFAGWLVIRWLPNDDKAIRTLMDRLVETASVRPEDSGFSRLAYGDRLASFFTTNATVSVEGFGGEFSAMGSRTELAQAAMAARTQLRQADFAISSLTISFPGEKGAATAYVVVTGRINSQQESVGQAFRMVLKKAGGRWLIHELTTIERLR